MAGGGAPVPPSGGGGKKSVDFQLNLIPLIDLLSVLISFLLINAVWTQVARIEVRQQPNMALEDVPPPEEEEKLNLTVTIRDSGYEVSKQDAPFKTIEKRGDAYDADTLSEVLKKVVEEHTENRDVTITSEDKVPYEELIRVMDVCLENKLDGISVNGSDTT